MNVNRTLADSVNSGVEEEGSAIEDQGDARLLVYYFGFPHYRRDILRELARLADGRADFVSGSSSRGGVVTLTEEEFPELRRVASRTFGSLSFDKDIVRQACGRKYRTVVLSPSVTSLSSWAILACRAILRRRTLLWGQCGKPGDRSFKRLLQELMNRWADGLLVYGEYERAGSLELGLADGRVKVIHNSVNSVRAPMPPPTVYETLRRKVESSKTSGEMTIIYVGRVSDQKKVRLLIDAFRVMQPRYRGLKLIVIGDGPILDDCRRDYSGLGVEFLGAIYDSSEVDRQLRSALVAISPWEMGLFALEALRSGTLVAVPENPKNGSEIDALSFGVNAWSFEAGNVSSMCDAISQAINEFLDVDPAEYIASVDAADREWSPTYVARRILEEVQS